MGLAGELKMISFVRGVTRRRSSSTSRRKSFSSRSGSGTGVAPTKRVIDS